MKRRAKAIPVNFGIIGTGWPGQQHARAMAAIADANLYACADLDKTRRREAEAVYAPTKSFSDYHELLGDGKVDAVMICLPNFLHFPASLAALETCKHVFCEKPPTMNAAEMKVLHEEAARRRLVYFFGRQFRFTPGMRAAKALIAGGRTIRSSTWRTQRSHSFVSIIARSCISRLPGREISPTTFRWPILWPRVEQLDDLRDEGNDPSQAADIVRGPERQS